MTDDIWRPEDRDEPGRRRPGRREAEMDRFDEEEFGGPLFGDTSEQEVTEVDTSFGDDRLRLDEDGSGAMPHWTEQATGDVPRIERAAAQAPDPTDDLDVWSTFTSDTPVWKEGDRVDRPSGQVPSAVPADPTGEISWEDAPADEIVEVPPFDDVEIAPSDVPPAETVTAMHGAVDTAPREPARITIGTDPSGMPRRPDPKRRGGTPQRPSRSAASAAAPASGGRNLPVAIATGLGLAAVFLALTMWRPAGAVAFVTIVLTLAAVEYFAKVTEKGYRPAVAAGVLACAVAPLVAYWVGERGLPLVLALAVLAGALGFVAADSIEVGPMPNMAITMLGIVWIGMLGAFGGLILRYSNFFGGDNSIGTDTLVLVAIGVVANDVGAYFVGSAFGRTPLRPWISPNKSVEGFLGGMILTLIVMLIIGMQEASDTWSDMSHLLMLGIVISLFAPVGDLTESMFKRNLDVKDFGSLVKGHGGVLDRFDGFLFALPATYYLMLVVEPWTRFGS